jgi:ribosomal-protein-alanine N-acetyltransferase
MNSADLILQRPNLIHLDAAIAIHCDPETNRFNPFGTPTPATVENNLRTWIAHWEKNGFGYWAVSLTENPKQILGFGGITKTLVGVRDGLNLYFRLAPNAWGKGLGSAIANAGLHSAFIDLQAGEVLGLVRPNNLPSRRTLEKAGMRQIDTSQDVPDAEPSLIYRISSDDYFQRKNR